MTIVGLTQYYNVRLGRQQALHNLHITARLAAQAIDQTFETTLLCERLIAGQPAFTDAVARRDGEQIAQRLQEPLQFIPGAIKALVTDPYGTTIGSYPHMRTQSGIDPGLDDGVRGARERGWQPYVSAVHVNDDDLAEKRVDVSLPIYHGNAVVGLLTIEYRVEAVRSWVQRIRVDPEGFLYVVDHHGQLVVYPFQVLPGKPKIVSDWPPVAQPFIAEGQTLTFHDARSGRQWLAGVYPIGTTGWRVVAVQPEAAVLRLLYRVLWPMGAVVGLLALILILIGFSWAALQTSSLQLLGQNTKLLKELQQQQILKKGTPPDSSTGAPPS